MAAEFLVGAVFSVVDDASGPIRAIAEAMETLGGVANALQEKLVAIGEGAFGGLLAAGDKATAMLSEQVAMVDRLAASYGRLDAAAAARGSGAGAGPGRDEPARAGGRLPEVLPLPGGYGGRAPRERVPGSSLFGDGDDYSNGRAENSSRDAAYRADRALAEDENARRDAAAARRQAGTDAAWGHAGGVFKGMMPLIGGLASWTAEEAAAKEDLALRNVAIEGLHITPEGGQAKFDATLQTLRQLSLDASSGTIYSESQTAQAMPSIARELGFTGDEGMAKLGQIFRPALQAAEVAQMTGLTRT